MIQSYWLRRGLAVALVALFLPTATTACFGGFNLTRKVYSFNRSISADKWVRWLAFLVLSIVPIYGIAILVDVILANSIEFWSGKNPIADAGTTRFVRGPGGESVTMTLREDGSIDVAALDPDGRFHQLRLVKTDAAIEAFDAEGNLLARVGDDSTGEPALLAAAAR
jgi:hypothetical protein